MSAEDEQLLEQLGVSPGTTISGKYLIEGIIASGGMGAVLRAHHEVLDKTVAVKVMRPELASEKEAAQRFLREARAAAKIGSDFVCRVTDVDLLDDSTPYMVMEYLQGTDLEHVVDGPDDVVVMDAVDWMMQALHGLEAAHAIGIVHRDLKPSNLFLVERADKTRRVKVLDFGISKVMEGDSGGLKAGATTSTQAVLGTPRYMSPEQISSAKDVDARTDLWAIGLILYELLTKHYPFEGDNAGALLASVLTTAPPPIRSLRRDVPPELHAIVHRLLSKDREHRFSGARPVIKALGPFASRRIQALLLEADELAPAIKPTEMSGTPGGAQSKLDPDEMPTLEADVAAAVGQLDMSREELDALAEEAARRESAGARRDVATAAAGTRPQPTAAYPDATGPHRPAVPGASPFESTAQLPGAAEQAGVPLDEPHFSVPDASTTEAVAVPMRGAGTSGKGLVIGIAAVVALGIFGGGAWMLSRSEAVPQSSAKEVADTDRSDTMGDDVEAPEPSEEPAPVTSTSSDAPAPEPSAEVSAEPQPAADPTPQPKAAAPTRPTRPGPVPRPGPKPKPNLDALLGERD
jgi:serine/threonine-protein kinase